MADPYKNDMQGNRIKSNILYRTVNIGLLPLFLRRGEQGDKHTGILRTNEIKVLHSYRTRESRAHVVRTFYLKILSSQKLHIC